MALPLECQPFVQRAAEIEKHDPLMAYYCRLHALSEACAGGGAPPAGAAALLERLERDKASAGLGGDDAGHVRRFAEGIFERADRADRADRATGATAKAFYAASVFLDVLREFGELDGETAAKQRYAAFKAADINAAIKRGEKPRPGTPPLDGDDLGGELGDLAELEAAAAAAEARAAAQQRHQVQPPAPPPPAEGGWAPAWGASAFAAGDKALYRTAEGGIALATVVAVDHALVPPAYTVEVDGALRETEQSRLAAPPDPSSRFRKEEQQQEEHQPLPPPPSTQPVPPPPPPSVPQPPPPVAPPPASAPPQPPPAVDPASLFPPQASAAPPPPPPSALAPADPLSLFPPARPAPPAAPAHAAPPAGAVRIQNIMEAQRLVREGQTMIAHEDVPSAVATLRHALQCLTDPAHHCD